MHSVSRFTPGYLNKQEMMYLASCLLLVFSQLLAVVDSEQPNIVFVMADDYGYNDIGYHGSDLSTPTLDQLASEGVILENYYVQPICSPTRTQLMSGRYQIHLGTQHHVFHPGQPIGLPPEVPTITDKLKEVGYSTHMVGKWHLGFYKQEYCPWNRGFDSFFGFFTGGMDYYTHVKTYHGFTGKDLHDGPEPARGYDGQYTGNLFTQKAVDVIRNHTGSDKPLFLYLAYQNVHSPLQVPDEYVEPFQHIENENRRIYAGMVLNMDEGVKNVTDALKESGMWDNTIFVLSTDNGGKIGSGGSNWPLRGMKGSLYEGGIRGVGFVSGGAVPEGARGTVNHELLHVSDWFPTLVKQGSGDRDVIGDTVLDGFDQWKTITKGKASPRTEILVNIDPLFEHRGKRVKGPWNNRIRAAIRVGDYKLITGDPKQSDWYTINEAERVRSPDPPEKNIWLFNITGDPEERNDLSKEFPEVVQSMMGRLAFHQGNALPAQHPKDDKRCDPKKHGGYWRPWA